MAHKKCIEEVDVSLFVEADTVELEDDFIKW